MHARFREKYFTARAMFARNVHINDVHRATGLSHSTLIKFRSGWEPSERRRYRAIKRKIKLSEDKARAIFSDARCYKQIAYEYGISKPCVSKIKTRQLYTWATRSLPDRVHG